MKQDDRFFRLMHAVDDDLLEEAMQPVRRRRHVWIPLAAAACLCIAAALAAVPLLRAPARPEPKQTEEPQQELPLPKVPDYRIIGEALNTYILVEQAGSLLLIDKHAAHERILFEKLRADTEPVMPQLLLTPVLCEPEREEAAVLLENAELLAQYGYEISDYGDGVLAIRQIPTEIAPDDAAQSLTALAAELLTGRHADPTELRDRLLHTIACKAAIKGGWHTDPKEWEAVVHEVLTRNDLKYCPHGRPICLELTASQLERQFKRA